MLKNKNHVEDEIHDDHENVNKYDKNGSLYESSMEGYQFHGVDYSVSNETQANRTIPSITVYPVILDKDRFRAMGQLTQAMVKKSDEQTPSADVSEGEKQDGEEGEREEYRWKAMASVVVGKTEDTDTADDRREYLSLTRVSDNKGSLRAIEDEKLNKMNEQVVKMHKKRQRSKDKVDWKKIIGTADEENMPNEIERKAEVLLDTAEDLARRARRVNTEIEPYVAKPDTESQEDERVNPDEQSTIQIPDAEVLEDEHGNPDEQSTIQIPDAELLEDKQGNPDEQSATRLPNAEFLEDEQKLSIEQSIKQIPDAELLEDKQGNPEERSAIQIPDAELLEDKQGNPMELSVMQKSMQHSVLIPDDSVTDQAKKNYLPIDANPSNSNDGKYDEMPKGSSIPDVLKMKTEGSTEGADGSISQERPTNLKGDPGKDEEYLNEDDLGENFVGFWVVRRLSHLDTDLSS